jgi:hypothetical protein
MISDPIIIRNRMLEISNTYEGSVSSRMIGAMTGTIEKQLKAINVQGISEKRRLVYGFLFGDGEKPITELSSKDLDDAQVYALNRWIGAEKINDKWLNRANWKYELYWVVARSKIMFDVNLKNILTINQYNYLITRDGYAFDEQAMISAMDTDNKILITAIGLGGNVFCLDKISKQVVNPVQYNYEQDSSRMKKVSVVYAGDYEDLI